MKPDNSNTIFLQSVAFVNQTSKHLFITGKAGTGKTTFLKYIRDNTHKKMAVIAPTGVAAINAGGMTIHSFFQLPTGLFIPAEGGGWGINNGNHEIYNRSTLLKKLRIRSEKREVIKQLELLIIDEISMVRADLLDAVDTILRHIRHQPLLPFGGVQMVYIGDLFQLPPVAKNDEWYILSQYYKSPFFFDALSIQHSQPLYIELKKIYRQNDDVFINILNNIRNNSCTPQDLQLLHRYYNPEFKVPENENYITLTSHNAKAEAINHVALNNLSGKEYCYEAEITGEFNERAYPAEKILKLKVGAQVMFIKNDKGEARRYFNGKLATVSSLENNSIRVRFVNETEELELEKEKWENIRYSYDNKNDHVNQEELGTFTQYPVRLAWAITIHKSQGLTFEKAIVDAGASFAAGQVYVSLSRLTGLKGLILYSQILPGSISTDKRVLEFVNTERSEEELKLTFDKEQKLYIHQYLMQCFSWTKLLDALNDFFETHENSDFLTSTEALNWVNIIQDKTDELHNVAEKFARQLNFLCTTGQDDNYKALYDRITAACIYFITALDEQIKATEDYIASLHIRSKIKKYSKNVMVMLFALKRKKYQIQQSVQLAKALHHTKNAKELFDIIYDTHFNQETNEQNEEISQPSLKTKKTKGESSKLSLQLFINGKSVTDIANERNLSVTTIEGHLISFIATEQISVYQLVSKEVIEKLLEIINKNPEMRHSEIKQIAGESVSYSNIKAVVEYKHYLNAKIAAAQIQNNNS